MTTTHIQFKDQAIAAALRKRQPEHHSSGHLASCLLSQYLFLLDSEQMRLRETFSKAELNAICDVANGWAYDHEEPEMVAQGVLWMCVHDAEGIGEKWGIDQLELVRKIKALPALSQFALIDYVRKFWQEK